MAVEPDFSTFASTYESGQAQAVYTRLVADMETPVSAFLKLAEGRENAFLLESVQGGEARGRYSIIGLKPDLIWRCRNGKAEINRNARATPNKFRADPDADRPLESLRKLFAETRMSLPSLLPPMAVGLFGSLGYDMIRLIEKLPSPPPDLLKLPDAVMIRPTITAIFDSVRDEIIIVTPVFPEAGVDARAAYARAGERLNDTVADLERPAPATPAPQEPVATSADVHANTTRDEFLAMVAKAKEYIAAGDIFQVVPSLRFSRPFSLKPFALYRALRRLNPSPFLYYLCFPDFSIVGSSPEILVRLRNNTVTIRPIAGTRRRGLTDEEDKALAEELMADPKERAEHLMLLDLGRNDVGRISETGTVTVTNSFFIERYSHVMHLVSNVEGKLRPGLDAIDAFAAGLPAGTLSGAPKIRAMEIIDELEKEKRGSAYGGAVGYLAADGSMDICIMLRSAVVKDNVMYVQAGAGIVADSVPASEYQECVDKAKALLVAAEEAVRYASQAKRGQ